MEVNFTQATYYCYGLEVGKQGTPHIQGYVYFKNKVLFSTLKDMLPHAHIERARGNPEENKVYCSKEGIFTEIGKIPKQGKRTDMEVIRDMIQQRCSLSEIADTFPASYIRYYKGIQAMYDLTYTARSSPPQVIYIWGDTGVGKTRYAFDTYNSVYMKDHTQWWNGYTQQSCIVIDDFDGNWPFRDLLRLLDRYPYQGQTKGGYIHIDSPVVILTADRPIEEVFQFKTDKELNQFKRRFSSIRYIDGIQEEKKDSTQTNVQKAEEYKKKEV